MANMDQTQQNVRSVLRQIFGDKVNTDYKLTGSEIVIGRHPKCQIQLSSLNISRRHCILTHTNAGWKVKDNRSQNGTYINGRKLAPDENFLLECGDIVFLGPPSEMPQAFSYEEFVNSDDAENMVSDDSDIITLPAKRACEEGVQDYKKASKYYRENSSDSKTNKKHSGWDSGSTAGLLNKNGQKNSNEKLWTIENQPSSSNFLTSSPVYSKSSPEFDIVTSSAIATGNEQIFEISSTDYDYLDNSESLLILDSQNNHSEKNTVEIQVAKEENAEKEKELESKLALMSQQIEALKRSKLELLKNYEDVIEKNKVLDQQLADKEKNLEKDLQSCEVKAKNEVKSELLEKLEEELVCNICTELFIKPTVLDCSHTFCEFCIKEWKKKKNDCPICRCKIKTATRVRTLEEFIDKTLATLTPDQREKRENLIAERNKAENPPPPSVVNKTPRRRRGRYTRRLRPSPRVESPIIEIVHESSGSSSAPYSISSHIHYAEPLNPHVNIRGLDLPLSMFSVLFSR